MDGSIYFIQAENSELIKIGWTTGAGAGRLAALQIGSPEPLHMIKAIAASKANEREWHKRFLHLRTHGEWFKPATELLAAIKEAVDHEEIPPDARESQINIRISLTEKAQLQANAERAGKKLAPFLRDLGLSNGNVVATAPQPKGQGGAGTTGSSVPVAEPEALATEIAKLKGQGMTTPVATREAKKQREA